MDTDVVIIGAGPAGLSAASVLSERDVDFILLSREDVPCKDKPCGGFIPEAVLQDFHLGHFKGSYVITSLRATFPNMKPFKIEFETSMGVNASREDLGKAQLQSISKSDSIWLGAEAGRISINNDCVTVLYRKEETENSIVSNILIDASGASPVSLRFLDLRDRIPNSAMGYALQYQMKLDDGEASPPRMNDFYYGSEYSPRGYSWIFPRFDSAVVGSGGIISQIQRDGKRLQDYLVHLISDVETAKSLLKGMSMKKTESALLPLVGIVKPSYGNRIMLAGDAAGHCSPISGEGIAYSMKAGKYAALTAIDAVTKKDFSKKQLSKYERMWVKSFGSDLRWGLWLQKRFLEGSRSKSIGTGFLASGKSQHLIAEMLLGKRSIRSSILHSTPGYLKSKL